MMDRQEYFDINPADTDSLVEIIGMKIIENQWKNYSRMKSKIPKYKSLKSVEICRNF